MIIQTGQIKNTAVDITKGKIFFSLWFFDEAGSASKKMKNKNCIRAVVIRENVANVSSEPMTAIRQYFDLCLKSVV